MMWVYLSGQRGASSYKSMIYPFSKHFFSRLSSHSLLVDSSSYLISGFQSLFILHHSSEYCHSSHFRLQLIGDLIWGVLEGNIAEVDYSISPTINVLYASTLPTWLKAPLCPLQWWEKSRSLPTNSSGMLENSFIGHRLFFLGMGVRDLPIITR